MAEAERRLDRVEIMRVMRGLGSGKLGVEEVPEDLLRVITKITKRSPQELIERGRIRREREARSPHPGTPAPEFELELLSPEGRRTGERRRLSDHRGRAVALIFGSYT